MFADMDVARTPEKDRPLSAYQLRRIISGALAIGSLAMLDLQWSSVAVAQTSVNVAGQRSLVGTQPGGSASRLSSTRRIANLPASQPPPVQNHLNQSNASSASGPVRIAQEPRLAADSKSSESRSDLLSEPLSVARDTLYPPPSLPPLSTGELSNAVDSELLEPMEPERIWPIRKYNNQDTIPNELTRNSPVNYLPPQRPIGQISIDVRSKPKGTSNDLPEDLAQQTTGTIPTVVAARADEMNAEPMYAASLDRAHQFPYQPLYFEEINLERYGRSNCGVLQPAASGLRFFATIPSLPYAMTVHKPNQAYHWRWPYEAGWGAPRVRELRPLELKPSLVQASAMTGLIFVVP